MLHAGPLQANATIEWLSFLFNGYRANPLLAHTLMDKNLPNGFSSTISQSGRSVQKTLMSGFINIFSVKLCVEYEILYNLQA